MFTGLVVERGRLTADPERSPRGGITLRIGHSRALAERLGVGASLAVAGVCLTVVEANPSGSAVQLSPETVEKTRLARLAGGDEVNLEPALRVGDPVGGHWVMGHVDGLLKLIARRESGDHARFTLGFEARFGAWIVEKGSLALDGVSLTVASRDARTFDVALVSHTLAATTLGAARPGDELHFEADVVARYVAHALRTRGAAAAGAGDDS